MVLKAKSFIIITINKIKLFTALGIQFSIHVALDLKGAYLFNVHSHGSSAAKAALIVKVA